MRGNYLSFVALSLELTKGSKFTTSMDESAVAQSLLRVDLKGCRSEGGLQPILRGGIDREKPSPTTHLQETSSLKRLMSTLIHREADLKIIHWHAT